MNRQLWNPFEVFENMLECYSKSGIPAYAAFFYAGSDRDNERFSSGGAVFIGARRRFVPSDHGYTTGTCIDAYQYQGAQSHAS